MNPTDLVDAFANEMKFLNDGCTSEEEFCAEAMKLTETLVNVFKGLEPVPQSWIDFHNDLKNPQNLFPHG